MLSTLLLLTTASLVSAYSFTNPLSEINNMMLFSKFIKTYEKTYSSDELSIRFAIFKTHLAKNNEHNLGNHSFTLGINQFSDLTPAEFRATYLGYKNGKINNNKTVSDFSLEPSESESESELSAFPTSIDWRNASANPLGVSAVVPVKNQGQCGSCWAFSAIAATEGAWATAGRNLTSLSEQQLVDCSTAYGNQGCNGGLMDQAFQYIIANKGITTESAYPYTAVEGVCNANVSPDATISSYKDTVSGSESSLLEFIQNGPVSVAIEADQYVFQSYTGGVLDSAACGTNLDHGVTLVGYGTDAVLGKDYWIVKNSWGSSWGESGYIRLVRDKNECGITLAASQPYV